MASVSLNHKSPNSVFIICVLGVIVVCSISTDQALAKSGRPISEYEIKAKKNQCYEDIQSGLWGGQCKSSMVAKENCALRCLSPACYELVYESDPLEEGEKDYTRNQEYKYCMHKTGNYRITYIINNTANLSLWPITGFNHEQVIDGRESGRC